MAKTIEVVKSIDVMTVSVLVKRFMDMKKCLSIVGIKRGPVVENELSLTMSCLVIKRELVVCVGAAIAAIPARSASRGWWHVGTKRPCADNASFA